MIANIPTELGKRTQDKWGSGEFGAPRGSHPHHGIDYACVPNAHVLSPCSGKVTKIGFPYADDLSFRYVEVTDSDNKRHRVFYIQPKALKNAIVREGDVLGYAQDLNTRYPDITPHIHYEIIVDGEYINPETI